jgi:hypothetical protein
MDDVRAAAVDRRPRGLGAVAVTVAVVAGVVLVQARGPARSSVTEPPERQPSSSARPSAPSSAPVSAASSGAAVPAVANPSPAAPPDPAEAVRAENALPGATDWRIPAARGAAPGLDVYLDRVSVLPGEPVGVYVSGSGPVTVRVLRIGWYAGRQAREVTRAGWTATPQPAARTLTAPIADAGNLRASNAVYLTWRTTGILDTTGWPEGEYLLRVDSATESRYAPLTVRSADLTGRLVVVDAPMTWQAYNSWGGRGLYGDENKALNRRSLAVSFDRPYSDGYGAGRFFSHDVQVVELAEKLGLPLGWVTDYDLAVDPGLVRGATGLVFGGHAEYWTPAMRAAVVGAVARGTNLAVFGANTAYWRIRLAGRGLPVPADPARRDPRPRLVVGTKDAALDPLARTDPAGATTKFKDPPAARLEDSLAGVRYDCFPSEAAWRVTDPSWWGYAGTALKKGDTLPGLVGPESDRAYPQPVPGMTRHVVAYTPLSCGGHPTAHSAVYSTDAAGAGIFAAGSIRFGGRIFDKAIGPDVAVIAGNVLREFALPRAGARHPTTEDVGAYPLADHATSGAT